MNFLFQPEDWSQWSIDIINSINANISKCSTMEQIKGARVLINSFIFVTALEENVSDKDIEDLIELFWLKLDLQKQIISETNQKELI